MSKITANSGRYILSMIDHKSTYELPGGIVLHIPMDYTNNLRERNPQLGKVEGIPDDNWLGLNEGDIVAVHHFTFHGDIGKDKSFTLQEHFEVDGVKLFPAYEWQIFFKYNNKTVESLPGYIVCKDIKEQKTLGFNPDNMDFIWDKSFVQDGYIFCGNDEFPKGKRILVLQNAFYGITLDGVNYFKVRESEIVAFVDERDNLVPVRDNIVVEYLPNENRQYYKEHPLALWVESKVNNIAAKIIAGSVNKKRLIEWNLDRPDIEGEILLVWINQGVKWGNYRVIDDDMIIWRYLDYGK